MLNRLEFYLTVAKAVFGFSPTLTVASFKKIPHGGYVLNKANKSMTIYCDPVGSGEVSIKFKNNGTVVPDSFLEAGIAFLRECYADEAGRIDFYVDKQNRQVLRVFLRTSCMS